MIYDMKTWVLAGFLIGCCVEALVCHLCRRSRNRDLWILMPPGLLVAGLVLLAGWAWYQESQRPVGTPGNCIGPLLYVLVPAALGLPPLIGMGAGWLLWQMGHKK